MKLSPISLIHPRPDVDACDLPPAKRRRVDQPAPWPMHVQAPSGMPLPAAPTPASPRRQRAGEQRVGKVWIASSRPLPQTLMGTLCQRQSANPSITAHLPGERVQIKVSRQTAQLCGDGPVALQYQGCSHTGVSKYYDILPGAARSALPPAAVLPLGKRPNDCEALPFVCIQAHPAATGVEALYLQRRFDTAGYEQGFRVYLASARQPAPAPTGKLMPADVVILQLDNDLRVVDVQREPATIWPHAVLTHEDLLKYFSSDQNGWIVEQPYAASVALLQLLGRALCGHEVAGAVGRDHVAQWYGALSALVNAPMQERQVAYA